MSVVSLPAPVLPAVLASIAAGLATAVTTADLVLEPGDDRRTTAGTAGSSTPTPTRPG